MRGGCLEEVGVRGRGGRVQSLYTMLHMREQERTKCAIKIRQSHLHSTRVTHSLRERMMQEELLARPPSFCVVNKMPHPSTDGGAAQ